MAPAKLADMLDEYADEPNAVMLAGALAGRRFASTLELADAIGAALPCADGEDRDLSVRRVFQAGLRDGSYEAIAEEVVRPTPEECRDNPRARPAKLRRAKTRR